MAKKKTAKAKKATPKKKAPKQAVKRTVKAKRTTPRAQTLPGLEQVRNTALDRICASIGDTRETINKCRSDEKDDQRMALREMHDKGVTSYRHAGVELVRIPGEEKLRVRTSKEDATDSTPADETTDAAPEPVADPPAAHTDDAPF